MKVGILGAGKMGGAVITHLKDTPEVSGMVAYDVSQASLDATAQEHGVQGSTHLRDILDDDAIKLVFVTAANHAHKDLTIQALEAGKAVMCEKPIANNLADAQLMVHTADRLGLFLQIGFELRYSKLYTTIKDWVDAGLLGQVVSTHCLYASSAYARSEWRNTIQQGGDTFSERISHYVDLTRWWAGSPVTQVYSACAPNIVPYTQVRDNYHTTYRFQSGAVGHVTYYMNFPATFQGDPLADNITDLQKGDGHELRYIITGTKGAAEADVFSRSIKRWQFTQKPELMQSDWVEHLTWKREEDHFYYHNTTDQARDVVRRVAQGLPPMTPASDALQTMRLCFAAEESASSGQVVTLQNPLHTDALQLSGKAES